MSPLSINPSRHITAFSQSLLVKTGRLLLFILYCLLIIQIPHDAPTPQLDPSWASALSYFAARNYQFGTDIIFTFGPLGYIYTHFYTGYLVSSHILIEVALKGFIAFQLTTITFRSGKLFGALCFLITIFFSYTMKDHLFNFSILCSLITIAYSPNKRWLVVLVLTFLAAVSLIKFSFLLNILFGLFLVMTYFLFSRQGGLLVLVLTQYSLTFVLFWILAGQSILSIPSYFMSSAGIVSDYQKSMFYPPPAAQLVVGLAILVFCAIFVVGLIRHNCRAAVSYVIAAIFWQNIFIAWRHGFLRADQEHIMQFYIFAQLSLVTMWSALRPITYRPKYLPVVGVTGIFLPLVGILLGNNYYWAVVLKPIAISNLEDNIRGISDFAGYRQRVLDELTTNEIEYSLPKVKALVKQSGVDIFGYEQGIALLNDLAYRPRPVFQSYYAYNSRLSTANQQFYLGPAAPNFVLLKLQSIDERLPAGDDAATFLTLLYNYKPVTADRGYLLLNRINKGAFVPDCRSVKEGVAAVEEVIALPPTQSPLWGEISWDVTTAERVREFLYQPSEVILEMTTKTGTREGFRLAEPIAKAGFLISPVLHDTYDVLTLLRGGYSDQVTSFAIRASPSSLRSHFSYKVSECPAFSGHINYMDGLRELRYWVFDQVPTKVISRLTPEIVPVGKSKVLMIGAPSEIVFETPKSRHVVQGNFGMQYSITFEEREPDEAEFFVEFLAPDGNALELFRRRLIPETNPADRGPQAFRVTVPQGTGGQIRLRVTIPSLVDKPTYKTYWSNLHFK